MSDGSLLAVVGAGAMGGQIAYQAALHGYDVRLISRSEDRLRAASASSTALLRRRVEKGTLEGDACEAALARVTLGSAFEAIKGAATIIELVAEDRDAKREVYARICEHADDTAIIGTNSSTMPSSLLEDAVTHSERFLNIHFFNPALLMALVEVVPGPHTAEDTVLRAMDFARAIGKTPVRLAREEYGFIANRILFIAIQEAMRLVEDGYVTIHDCDLAVRNALGWPMGPFQLSDLIGLDVVEAILDEGFLQTGDQRWEPVELLRALVASGRLGKKTGEGFFTTSESCVLRRSSRFDPPAAGARGIGESHHERADDLLLARPAWNAVTPARKTRAHRRHHPPPGPRRSRQRQRAPRGVTTPQRLRSLQPSAARHRWERRRSRLPRRARSRASCRRSRTQPPC